MGSSKDLYNLMVCGIINSSNWKATFSRKTLLSIYSNQTDIIRRYDNFSVNLLGHNINIKDQFTIWKMQIIDINNTNSLNSQTFSQYTNSILFILSYITLIEHYNISLHQKLPEIAPFIKIKQIQSTSTIFECSIHLDQLQLFIQNIIKLKNTKNKNNYNYHYNHNDNRSSSYYHNKRNGNGEIEEFDCKLMHYNKLDQLINEINGNNEIDDELFELLKDELFLPNLISFKECWSISIAIKLFEQIYFRHYFPRTLNYTAFCIKLESKIIKQNQMNKYDKYIESFLVWNGVLNDVVGSSSPFLNS